jgi:N-acetylneuraminate synthase
MANSKEISKAIKILKNYKSYNNELYLLHCVSIYPSPPEIINLKNILGFKKKFKNLEIGFSDHSLGDEFAIASIVLGARIIEKHFTLNKKQIGMDNNMALEPHEMKLMIEKCNNVYKGLGCQDRILSKIELEQRLYMRRSVHAKRNILINEKLTKDNLNLRRPGDGIPADQIDSIIGKTSRKNIKKGEKIFKKHLK